LIKDEKGLNKNDRFKRSGRYVI